MSLTKPTATGLALMREPFAENQISKLPKGTKTQNECQASEKVNCNVCGGWHHPKIKHLDYVGHAAITYRLLDCDPNWNWKPVAFGKLEAGELDANGGMWIELTVCGHSRLGYGSADGKKGGDAMKELIGDALRNAAMRFGAALDLWHKGDLEPDEPDLPITIQQSTELMTHLNTWSVTPEMFCASVNIRSVSELPSSKLERAFEWVAERGKKIAERKAADAEKATTQKAGSALPKTSTGEAK